LSLKEQVVLFEKMVIANELSNQRGSITATCEALQVARKTLHDKLRRYGLSREDYISE
jgi:two-component system C4-dicarboxylate transport response regulator DctD